MQINQTSLDSQPTTVALAEQITKPEPASLYPSTQLQVAEISLQTPLESMVLTRREQEVLGLLTMGFTNAQIANRLVVSLSTVNTHVRSIYNKLEVTSLRHVDHHALVTHFGYEESRVDFALKAKQSEISPKDSSVGTEQIAP